MLGTGDFADGLIASAMRLETGREPELSGVLVDSREQDGPKRIRADADVAASSATAGPNWVFARDQVHHDGATHQRARAPRDGRNNGRGARQFRQRPGARQKHTRWWARRVPERPSDDERPLCGQADCLRTGATPFDLYCRVQIGEAGNTHFLPLGFVPRVRITVAALAGGMLGVVAVWSASAPSRVPLLAAAGLAGTVMLALPLRFFALSRALAIAGWLIAFGAAAVWREGLFPSHAEKLIVAGVLAALLLGLVATVLVDDDQNNDHSEDDGAVAPSRFLRFVARILNEDDEDADIVTPSRFLASLLVSVIALGLFLLASEVDTGAASAKLSTILVLVLVALVALCLGAVAFTGLVRGVRNVQYDRPLIRPDSLPAPTVSRPQEPASRSYAQLSFLEGFLEAMAVVGIRIADAVAGGYEALLRGMWWLLNLAIAAAALVKHTIHVWVMRARMVLIHAVAQSLRELYLAAIVAKETVQDWAAGCLFRSRNSGH